MRLGLVANLNREGSKQAIHSFIEWSEKTKQDVIVWDGLSELLGKNFNYQSFKELPAKCEVLVSMGGDGTLIHSARMVADKGTLLLGINIGSLGFLTQITPQQMVPCLERIVDGDYQIEQRMALSAQVDGLSDTHHALNEMVVDNGPVSRMIDVTLKVNEENIVNIRCDGLIIATPTGSTAYSLAVGGPIMHPTMEAIIASPISAFSLSTRPMIFRPTDELELTVNSEHEVAGLTVDAQVMKELSDGDTVKIKRAGFMHKFIVFRENSFYGICRSKLHWGASPSGESD